MILRARFVVPVAAPPIENAAIEIGGGIIKRIGPSDEFPRSGTDFGDAVIVPGLVNAHTHLELSHLAGQVPPDRDFVGWIKRLVATRTRAGESHEVVQGAVNAGIAQSIAGGATAIGDISRLPHWTRPVLAAAPIHAVSYGEVIAFGRDRHRLDQKLIAAADQASRTRRLSIGISPHAPYTVEPVALRACAERAASGGFPLCIHLAESQAELEFIREGTGAFADWLRELESPASRFVAHGVSPVALAERCGVLGPRTLVAHANHVSDADIAILARRGCSVVYCPRTHDAFGHPRHRFRDMLAAGVNVCIGTDSLASTPSLSMLDELRFLHRKQEDVLPGVLLEMATTRGARALGLQASIGTLTPGGCADIAVLALPLVPSSGTREGWSSFLEHGEPPRAVYLSGNLMNRRE